MRSLRRGLPVLGWLATTALSMALGWVALLPVMRAATPAGETPLQLPQTGPLPSTAAARPSPSPSPEPSTARSRSTAPRTTPPSSAPTSPAPATVNGWAVTTGPDGKPSYLRSFRVAGGQAVIRISGGKVQLVTATPSQNYAASSVQNKPEDLAVYFTEPGHGFTIHAIWWDDQPYAEVSSQ